KIGALTSGTKVYVTAFNDRWCRISYDGGKRGWVAEELLQFSAHKGRKLAAEAAKRAPANPPAWVKVPSARVRSGAGQGYRHVTSIPSGAKVHIIGRSGSWRKVKLASGTVGWMRGDLLETNADRGRGLGAALPAPRAESRPIKAFVNGNDVNVREGPGTSSGAVDQLDRGATVWVIDTQDDWRKVKYEDGKGGWVAYRLLKYAGAAAPGEAAAAGTAAVEAAPEAKALPTPEPEPPLESMYGWVAEEPANLRYGPGDKFDVKSEVPAGTKVTVLDVDGHWCKVRVGPQEYGWMAAWCVDFLGAGNQVFAEEGGESVQVHVGWATGSTTTVRTGPGTEHKQLTSVPRGTTVVILAQRDNWYQVALSDNKVGWISSGLISTREEALARGDTPSKPTRSTQATERPTTPPAPTPAVAPDTGTFGGKLAKSALGYLRRGIRYVWGGCDPSRGFDCSGFVRYVLSTLGYRLPHNAAQQYKYGTPVSSARLRPGDLVFFRNTTGRSGISHVGIYIGGGQFIHSSSARRGMVVSTLRSGYYAHKYAGARRVQ
ncbi:MAG: SH3 domain-containing protein, partial [Armatimonadota bacterium]